ADLARHLPTKLAAGKLASGLAADMHRERRRGIVKELLGVIVGEDDPEVRLARAQPFSDFGRDRAHVLDVRLVLGLGHGEELWGKGEHGATDDGLDTLSTPSPSKTTALGPRQKRVLWPQRQDSGGFLQRRCREPARLLMCPLPACGERAALIVQQTRSGEGA